MPHNKKSNKKKKPVKKKITNFYKTLPIFPKFDW